MRNRSRMAAFLLATSLTAPAGAQESVFSLQFLGVSEESGDPRARGLGVLGVAIDDPRTALGLNPAAQASLRLMTLSGMGLGGRRTSRGDDLQVRHSQMRFPQERIALPVFGKAVLSLGYVGLRNFDSTFETARLHVAGFTYKQTFQRRGTLYQVPLVVARRLGSRLLAGASLDFLFGTVDESWFSGGDSLLALRTRRRDEFSGRTVTLGLIARPLGGLRLGSSWSPSFGADRTTRTTLEDARVLGAEPLRPERSVKGEARFPAVWRAGAGLDIGRHWLVSSDFLRRDWGQYEGRLYGAESVGLESRLGGGVEWRPGRNSVLGRLAYRVGLSRTTWPQRVGGNPLRDTTLHFGAGLEFPDGRGRLDAGFEYAWIGSRSQNGLEERAWRLVVGISAQEMWKRKSPR